MPVVRKHHHKPPKKSLLPLYQLYSVDQTNSHQDELFFDFSDAGSEAQEDFAQMTRNSIAVLGGHPRTVSKRRNKEMRLPTTLDVSTNTIVTFAPKSLQYALNSLNLNAEGMNRGSKHSNLTTPSNSRCLLSRLQVASLRARRSSVALVTK